MVTSWMRRAVVMVLAVGMAAGSSLGQAFTETFDAGIPASWSIVDNFPLPGIPIPDHSAVPWTTNVPEGMGNYTAGGGQAATASSYNHSGQYDISLIMPAFTISPVPGEDNLRYRINYQRVDAFEAFDTNISINGAPWVTMVHDTSSLGAWYSAGPPNVMRTIDMGFFGAMPGDLVRVEFRYQSTYLLPMVHNEYVQIDDVNWVLPEPATLTLLGLGGLVSTRRRRLC